MLQANFEQVPHAIDVNSPGHRRIEFARFQSAVARAIQHGGESVLIEQLFESAAIFSIADFDTRTAQPPIIALADADHLAWVPGLQIWQRVETRDAGNARHQQRQRRLAGECGTSNHGNLTGRENYLETAILGRFGGGVKTESSRGVQRKCKLVGIHWPAVTIDCVLRLRL